MTTTIKLLFFLLNCCFFWEATAQKHPIFGVYKPNIIDNVSPFIDGELEIVPDVVFRKAWIYNFVEEGPLLAVLSIDSQESLNRIYDVPRQKVGNKLYELGSLIYTHETQSIILEVGKPKNEISFLGYKTRNSTQTRRPPVENRLPPQPEKPVTKPAEESSKNPEEAIEKPNQTQTGEADGELRPGKMVRLNSVYFVLSKAELLPESFAALDTLTATLLEHPKMAIRLEGHTDVVGEADKNLKLSVERVETIKKYLAKKGIAPARVETKGYGDTRPLITKGSVEDRKINRRVEMVILRM